MCKWPTTITGVRQQSGFFWWKTSNRFVNSSAQCWKKRSDLRIVSEVSDGLEAVRQAEELQPDLILLDIGLPTLNGIAAARRIRTLSPKSRIIFVSQESSDEVVGEGLSIGAAGYVVKARAWVDLPAAVEAVLKGRQFLSSVVWGQLQTVSPV